MGARRILRVPAPPAGLLSVSDQALLSDGSAPARSSSVSDTGTLADAAAVGTGPRFMVGVRYSDVDAEETAIGAALDHSRIFDGGFSTNATTTQGGALLDDAAAGRASIYSFKPSIQTLAAGTSLNSSINTLLASIPAGHPTALVPWHEPEDDTAGSHGGADPAGWTYQQYRDAYARFADLVHATGRPELKTIWLMMGFSWKLSSNRDPELWYPGDSYVDLVGIDCYLEGSLNATQRWDSPGFEYGTPDPTESLSSAGGGYVYGGFRSWVAGRGKNYIVCEVGAVRRSSGSQPAWTTNNGVPWTKAGWIGYGATSVWAADPRCIGVTYFDFGGRTQSGTGESWQLRNDPGGNDLAAWGQVASTYGYRANGEAVPW